MEAIHPTPNSNITTKISYNRKRKDPKTHPDLTMTSKQQEATATTATAVAPVGTRLTIRLPDDFHHHVRDGATTAAVAAVLIHATKRFGRCLVMPNTKPPITTTEMAMSYKQHIETSLLSSSSSSSSSSFSQLAKTRPPHFQPLLVLYLTDQTTPQEIRKAHAAGVIGCKYYPAGNIKLVPRFHTR